MLSAYCQYIEIKGYLMEVRDIITKYNFPVPRYTSYPTAPNFKVASSDVIYTDFLREDKFLSPISLYIHIPFCPEMCWYCGCNTQITKREDLIEKYIYALCQEMDLLSNRLGRKLTVNHIHFGGGTPNSISVNEFDKVMQKIHSIFNILPDAEIAAELDPRTLSDEMIDCLARQGINRVSLGVQDFDLEVQKAIHRVQPYELVAEKLDKIRNAGIEAVNFDLIYGLPCQNLIKMHDTIQKVEKLQPNRLSVFAYAHVPWMKSHQKMIAKNPVPSPASRLELMLFINSELKNIGYQMIGIDHFAKPNDKMTIAYKEKKLHRNFQGYTTDTAQNLIGLGASSISKLDRGYFQNETKISAYQDFIKDVRLPIKKELILTEEDKRRARIIEQIMCYFEADIPDDIFLSIKDKLTPLKEDGIIILEDRRVSLQDLKYSPVFARILASYFDKYFKIAENRHAKAV